MCSAQSAGTSFKSDHGQLVIHLITTPLLQHSRAARHGLGGRVVILAESSRAKRDFPNMTGEERAEQTK